MANSKSLLNIKRFLRNGGTVSEMWYYAYLLKAYKILLECRKRKPNLTAVFR